MNRPDIERAIVRWHPCDDHRDSSLHRWWKAAPVQPFPWRSSAGPGKWGANPAGDTTPIARVAQFKQRPGPQGDNYTQRVTLTPNFLASTVSSSWRGLPMSQTRDHLDLRCFGRPLPCRTGWRTRAGSYHTDRLLGNAASQPPINWIAFFGISYNMDGFTPTARTGAVCGCAGSNHAFGTGTGPIPSCQPEQQHQLGRPGQRSPINAPADALYFLFFVFPCLYFKFLFFF